MVGRVEEEEEEATGGVTVILGAGTRDRRAAAGDVEDARIAGARQRYQPSHMTSAPMNDIESQSRMRWAYAAASVASTMRTIWKSPIVGARDHFAIILREEAAAGHIDRARHVALPRVR